MIFAITILFLLAESVIGQPCEDVLSVDISNGIKYRDGTVTKDGVIYHRNQIYSKNIGGEMITLGCLCNLRDCFRKCCPFGSFFYINTKLCANDSKSDLLLQHGTNLSYLHSFKRNVDIRSHFSVVYGKPCEAMYVEDPNWHVQEVFTTFAVK